MNVSGRPGLQLMLLVGRRLLVALVQTPFDPKCMIRRVAASAKQFEGIVRENVSGLFVERSSWP